MQQITPELADHLASLSAEERGRYVFLENHATIEHHWKVNGYDPAFIRHFAGVLNQKRILSPFAFPAFQARAEAEGLEIVFLDDPAEYLDWAESLSVEPDVTLNEPHIEGATASGLLPFQVQGYNMLKGLKGSIANWSTGTGKTVLAAALTKHHQQEGHYNLCLWVVKPHNKVNTQRTLKALVGLDSIVVDGPPAQREQIYAYAKVTPGVILIINYEKFRDDMQDLRALLTGRDVFIVWDEMPTKLKNRSIRLYKSVRRALFFPAPNSDREALPDFNWKRKRPRDLWQIMLSATPIEQSPDDLFSCVRILDQDERLGTVKQFHHEHVRTWKPFHGGPATWKGLTTLGAKLAPITHQVDKADEDIAKQFPKVLDTIVEVDLGPDQQRLYDRLMRVILADGSTNDISDSAMAKIGVAQMLLNHPMAVLRSAKRREMIEAELVAGGFPAAGGSKLAMDLVEIMGVPLFEKAGSAKIDALSDILDGLGKREKGIIFTSFNASIIPLISDALTTWGYNHVTYAGGMSMKDKQAAEDKFKTDPTCQLFLSSDAGSDSINLEVASLVVHYDLPWKWSTVIQRQNRAHRITSKHKTVRYYALLTPNTVEDRKQKIIATKRGYHDAIFKGAVADQSESMRLTKGDLRYILTGEQS